MKPHPMRRPAHLCLGVVECRQTSQMVRRLRVGQRFGVGKLTSDQDYDIAGARSSKTAARQAALKAGIAIECAVEWDPPEPRWSVVTWIKRVRKPKEPKR